MDALYALLPLAGCGAMMLVCARMMTRGGDAPNQSDDADEVARLRDEVAELRQQLDAPESSGRGLDQP